jgi:hypothetical protein
MRSCECDGSIGARHSRDKQQQATTTLPIAMDMIKAIANFYEYNQRNHHESQSAHKRSLSNAMRKTVAISLKATVQPCWRM